MPLLLAALIACRGEAAERPPAPPPADEKLAWPALDEGALISLIATQRFELGAPVPLAIAPDGAVLFRRSKPRDPRADLYQQDATGKTAVLATAAALAGDAAGAPGIDDIELSADAKRILVSLGDRLFVIERATGAARELAVGAHDSARLSPDGARIAFVRDGDLWVAAIDAPGAPAAPAPPAAPAASAAPAVALRATRVAQHPPGRTYATPEAVARQFGRADGYWWSPDGQSIAFQRTDERAVETVYRADLRHPERAPAPARIPRAGTANATVDVGIASLRGGPPRWVTWDLARYPYLARVIWPARGPLTLIVVGRDQSQLAVLAVDPATGATRPLLTEADPAWLNVAPDALTWLPDGSGFLWMTERHGAWSVEHRAADGALVRQLTTPDAGLRRVVGVSADGRDAIIEAANDAREHHVWRIPLTGDAGKAGDAAAARPLTSGGGIHRALVGHGVVVISSSQRGGGRITTVLRGDAGGELPSVAEQPPAPPTTVLESVVIDDHAQFAAITRPRALDPKVRYPVLLRLGAIVGPGSKLVLDARDAYLLDQWYADAGFIVVRTDGRGTPDRDRAWERAIAGDMLTIPMNDQIGALRRLGGRHPELDIARVGAIGSEAGGYLATLGAMIHPEAFAAAIARFPITDWALLDAALAERYMRTPAANPEGYRRTSAATYAEQLTRPLLIIHGATDPRVPFAHTLALLDALSAAGKHVALATRPPTYSDAREIADLELQIAFLREHLGPPVRPAVMPKPRPEEGDEEEEEREREERETERKR